MTIDTLSHVYWIGGSPCAGKSTAAAAIAARFGMTSYNCDDAFEIHEHIVDPERSPTLHRVSRLSWNELWMRPVDQQIREEMALYREEMTLILDDLRNLPADRPILAEGTAFMPAFLDELGIPDRRTIWLVPTPAFQRAHYARRDWVEGILAQCDDPGQAWHNWMERDIDYAARVAEEARALGRKLVTVNGSQSPGEVLAVVEAHFGLPGGILPAARHMGRGI
jgi:hypothetical protein